MIPFANFLYFAVSLYVVVPAMAARLAQRLARAWILLATLLMLALQYTGVVSILPGTAVPEIALVAVYAALQGLVATIFLWSRPRTDSRFVFYAAVALSLLPLALAKWVPLLVP